MDLRDGQNFTKYNMNVYDPLTSHPCVDREDVSGTCSSPYIRDPFPGNVFPASRISPIGQKILSYYPAPNSTGMTDNYVSTGSTGRYRYEQPMARWDHAIDDRNRLYTIVTFQDGSEYRNSTVPGPAAGGNIDSDRTNFNAIADWTRIISPTAIFDLRASFGRFSQKMPHAVTDGEVTTETLGITNMVQAPASPPNQPPRITIDQFSNLFGNNANLYTLKADNQWNVVPSVTLTSGTKTLRFGVDMVYAMMAVGRHRHAPGHSSVHKWGTLPVSPALRAECGRTAPASPTFCSEFPSAGLVDWNDTFYRTWPYFGFFVQNDWKVRRNLTLNLGLRYDVQIPWVERFDRINNGFDYNAKNPLSDQIMAQWKAEQGGLRQDQPALPVPRPAGRHPGRQDLRPAGRPPPHL